MIYLSSVIVFGLMQIWILIGFLMSKQISFTLEDLIKDGGLFIFATSLALTTFIHHRKIFSRVTLDETYWSFFFTVLILSFCIIGFVSSINIDNSSFKIIPNIFQNCTQIVCSAIAIAYGFVVDYRLKLAIK